MKVAIKVMDKVKLQNNIEYIIEEIACLQKLDHPNIVRYYETYNDAKFVYLVMEHVSGEKLSEKRKRPGERNSMSMIGKLRPSQEQRLTSRNTQKETSSS